MAAIASQRCFQHFDREAIARCPECTRFFCRECITEHEDRIICAECLQKLTVKRHTGKNRTALFSEAARLAHTVLGFLLAWYAFHYVGESLLKIPSTFHDETLWKLMEALE